jgi:hypothetical protein
LIEISLDARLVPVAHVVLEPAREIRNRVAIFVDEVLDATHD